MVDGGRVVAVELELAAGAERGAGALGDFLAHARFDQVEHLEREGAHRALDLAGLRHHVGASPVWIMVTEITPASMGRFVARDDGLEPCTIWQATGTGSMPVRQRGVRALAADGDRNSLLDAGGPGS